MSDWSDEETDEPLLARRPQLLQGREVESRTVVRLEELLFAGNSLGKAQGILTVYQEAIEVEADDQAADAAVPGLASIILTPRLRELTLNRRCSAVAGPDGLQRRSWYKGDLHELMFLGSGHASLLCVSWQARRVLTATCWLNDRSTNI